jgi:ABC-2 type transport system ATP-binding protein
VREVLPKVGALVEGPSAYGHLSGRANLALIDAAGSAGSRRTRRRRIEEALEQTGLAGIDGRSVRKYSLGMRQRLGLAAALLRAPRLLVLDEPANGLDPQGIREIRDLLVRLNEAGTTVFLSSHQLAEVEQLCTRVGVIDRGRLVLQADLAALQPVTGRVIVRSPDTDRAVAELNGQIASRDGDQLVVTGTDPAQLNTRLVSAGLRVIEIRPERRSLEDLVLELTGPGTDRVDRDASQPGSGRNAQEAGQHPPETGASPP